MFLNFESDESAVTAMLVNTNVYRLLFIDVVIMLSFLSTCKDWLICIGWLVTRKYCTRHYTAKNAQPVPGWWKQDSTMLCCTPRTLLSTILLQLVILNNNVTILSTVGYSTALLQPVFICVLYPALYAYMYVDVMAKFIAHESGSL